MPVKFNQQEQLTYASISQAEAENSDNVASLNTTQQTQRLKFVQFQEETIHTGLDLTDRMCTVVNYRIPKVDFHEIASWFVELSMISYCRKVAFKILIQRLEKWTQDWVSRKQQCKTFRLKSEVGLMQPRLKLPR